VAPTWSSLYPMVCVVQVLLEKNQVSSRYDPWYGWMVAPTPPKRTISFSAVSHAMLAS
jgi:hypothetical protein